MSSWVTDVLYILGALFLGPVIVTVLMVIVGLIVFFTLYLIILVLMWLESKFL